MILEESSRRLSMCAQQRGPYGIVFNIEDLCKGPRPPIADDYPNEVGV